MIADNTVFLRLIFIPIAIGICLTVLLLIALLKANKKSDLSLRSYAIGYGVCVSVNVFILVITMGFLLLPCYIITFGPLMIYSFMLTKKIINSKRLRNSFINSIYKFLVTLLIWFMAFFPFSLFGITKIINIPAENAVKQEISQFQEEILNSETYVDLTQFDLGIYKLQNEGNRYLWDITQQGIGGTTRHIHNDGYLGMGEYTRMVYKCSENRKHDETWDDSNRGKDILYDVYLFEETYIIVTPITLKMNGDEYFYIFLTKELKDDADLFLVTIPEFDRDAIKKLQELPGEKLTRKELTEKLGKDKWESVTRQQ